MYRTKAIAAVRWCARVLAALTFLLITSIAIGEGGPPNPWTQPWRVNLGLHIMFAMWVGMILVWRWEVLGGALMAAGVTAFCSVERCEPNPLFVVILLAGAAFIFCGLIDPKKAAHDPPPSAPGDG